MSMSSTTRAGAARRLVAGTGLVLLLLVPLAVIFRQFWTSRTQDLAFNQDERRGVQYLGPLTALIGAVAQQQSAAVHGRSVATAAVEQAVAAVDAVDRELGGRLQTTPRWTELRQQVLAVAGRGFEPNPIAAYTSYSGVGALAVQLLRKVGDTSNLILDPAIDAYYVMNAALLRIPDVLVQSGRYSDLVKIANATGKAADPTTLAELASACNDVQASAEDLDTGLRKAFEATESATLGPALLQQLDGFEIAVDALAPRFAVLSPTPAATLNPLIVEGAQGRVRQSTMDLDTAALAQLDLLLKARVDTISGQRREALAALLAGVLLTVAAVAWLGPGRRTGTGAPRLGGRHGERPDVETIDARELVASSGLAVSARRGGGRAAR
jgi:hypothetical protein